MKNLSRRFGALLFLLAACVAQASAQIRANLPWWNSPVVNDLGLTAEQQTKIRQIVRGHRAKLLDARNAASKADGDLDDLLNDAEVDMKQADTVINRVAAARAESSRVFLDMSVQLRAVLTLDQWRTLIRRWDEVTKKRALDTQVPP